MTSAAIRPVTFADLAAALPERNLRTLASNAAMAGDKLGARIARAAADAPPTGPKAGPRRRVIRVAITGGWDLDLTPIRVRTRDGSEPGYATRIDGGRLLVVFDSADRPLPVRLADLAISE